MKKCTHCHVTKDLESFYKHTGTKSGVASWCISCQIDQSKNASEDSRKRKRSRYLQRTYGISLEDYDTMYEAQQGSCALCLEYRPTLVVDHNHDTGEVRGLLCDLCNIGLGAFRDSPYVLKRAIEYLT